MTESFTLPYTLFFAGALFFSFFVNRFLLKFSGNLGIRNTNETIIRWSSTSKPALGGISFFIIFLLSVIVISFIIPDYNDFFNLQTLGMILVVSIGFLMGLFDDAYNTRPWLKFFTQLLCGVLLVATGTYIDIFSSLFLNYALTVFWVVGMMNSINMLDNMDGITSIVSLSILLSFLLGMWLSGDGSNPLVVIILGIIAVLLAFLYFNWYPSKMYMGDTGSQFLGVLLAALGVNSLWNGVAFGGESTALMRFLAVAIVFALPIIDTTTVFIKRIARGQSPFVGGKDHTTHHISYLGFSDGNVAIIFAVLSVISVVLGLLVMNFLESWKIYYYILFGAYFVALFAVLFTIANLNKAKAYGNDTEKINR